MNEIEQTLKNTDNELRDKGGIKMTIDSINLKNNKSIICPHCKTKHYVDSDYYGNQDEELDFKCENCRKDFIYMTDYGVTFSTRIKVELK